MMKQLPDSAVTLLWVVFGFVVVGGLTALTGSRMVADIIIHVSILGLFAVSLNILVGYTGLVSFGHAMFFASGAYGFGLMMQSGGFSIPFALVLSMLISAAISLVVGYICLKTREIYFAFLTLAIQMLFYSSLLSWVDLTGGDQGLTGGFDKPAFMGIDLGNQNHLFLFILFVSIVSLGVLWHITKTPFGYTLRMIRDNATRVEAFGLNVNRYRLAAFVIASSAASVAGALMCVYVSAAYPNFGYWTMSGEAIFMIMLGGLNSFLGPLVGAAILTLLNHWITAYTELYGLVLGTIILIYVLVLRQGLLDMVLGKWRVRQSRLRTSELPISAVKSETYK
ncbi:branched-chain amino acid ABC transporter permease [Pollutimonas nitritireducens]|uniref:Branched-chain amino acid ABC transporter permease n=1 Tax=Pollutimonas nitritireducens TaxID=2045209 RepID=A0A2N4UB86_9BURK|nr:branched-chain amino acid ABC transporter permease [Pollutimonas nitritireducens]PLC52263.1 branched-chain amino acid ABC transporter permease [Pollutimonas nitritireducens]